MRTIKISFVIAAFGLLLFPSLGSAQRKMTVHKPPSVTTSTYRSLVVRGDMTRINISLSASGKSAAAARKRVGSAGYQAERKIQKLIPDASVVKGPISVGGRYVRGNSGYSWRNEDGRSSQNIVIEFKGTSGVKAAKVIDFAAEAAKKASGKNTPVTVDISEAEHYLSQAKMNRAMNKLGRQLRAQATGKARGLLHANEKLDPSGQIKISTGGYSPWRGGGYRVYGDLTLTADINKKK
jgi:hypothetical protein